MSLLLLPALILATALSSAIFAVAAEDGAPQILTNSTPPSDHFDAAPFGGALLPERNGLLWNDPREIHEVVVRFEGGTVPDPSHLHLEYWGSHWPEQHLPKDREPGGGNVGWMELGNWHVGGWRVADTVAKVEGNNVSFTFRPVSAKEFPKIKDYDAPFRYTLKVRLTSDQPLPRFSIEHVFTDSTYRDQTVRLAWKSQTPRPLGRAAFNGILALSTPESPSDSSKNSNTSLCTLRVAQNPDPNTFDRTVVTVKFDTNVFSFKVDDLAAGPLFLPQYGVAVLPGSDHRSYAEVERDLAPLAGHSLYETVGRLPEQTWRSAWDGMPAKKSRICFPLGLDGARQKFRLDANGDLFIRWNDQFMRDRPGRDSARLLIEKQPVHFHFGFPDKPLDRHIEEESLPICLTTWDVNGLRVRQTAFATRLEGNSTGDQPPPPDVFAVAILQFQFSNDSDQPRTAMLPLTIQGGESYAGLTIDSHGLIWNGAQVRGQVLAPVTPVIHTNHLDWTWTLAPHSSRQVAVKMPYLPLTEPSERQALLKLDPDREHKSIAAYWRARLDQGSQLISPEPVLNEFYRSVPAHLLINSEFDPEGPRRFARVGSFNYGAYGNESCMMIMDLERRGYFKEAGECLEAWLHYQSTVALPGDFSSHDGVLYGAGGYESGGYNQHHGWILWMLAEHYRFTRDEAWLRHAAPGIRAAADWIIRETSRTADHIDGSRGLLPSGDLEDIGDWWTWLSTSCYTWRGLDAAAWAMEQLHDPDASRLRQAATKYHSNLMTNFSNASIASPVVRLRDGTAVPQIPSYAQRHGRSFGWICQTLEGPIHLLITRAIDPNSPQATAILKDYEDNLYLSNQYGYTLADFDRHWFGRGGMSMQPCLLFGVEPYLYRDDIKQALRAVFNAIAVAHFPDVHMNTEHPLPEMGDWLGDHYKTSDEANACGWLRYLFAREEGASLLVGSAIPRDWLQPGRRCGLERGMTTFGPMSVLYTAAPDEITARLTPPSRNAPEQIHLRFRESNGRLPSEVRVNGNVWPLVHDDWVILPGDIGPATIQARYNKPTR